MAVVALLLYVGCYQVYGFCFIVIQILLEFFTLNYDFYMNPCLHNNFEFYTRIRIRNIVGYYGMHVVPCRK